MIVLDLYAEVKPVWINSDQLYGVPYIWKVLFSLSANSMHYYPPFIFLHKKTRVTPFQVHAPQFRCRF